MYIDLGTVKWLVGTNRISPWHENRTNCYKYFNIRDQFSLRTLRLDNLFLLAQLPV